VTVKDAKGALAPSTADAGAEHGAGPGKGDAAAGDRPPPATFLALALKGFNERLDLGLNDEQPQRLCVRERLALAGRLLLAHGLAQQVRLVVGLPKRHSLA
jgi:hypothetical protein